MPDLSDLLGDVYGEPDEAAPGAPAGGPRPPEWSDDEHLDKAFSEWTPGPGADASDTERDMFAPPAPRLADDLAAALSEAVLAEKEPVAAVEADVIERDEPDMNDAEVEEDTAVHAVIEAPAPRPAPMATAALSQLEPERVTEPVAVVAPTPVHKPGWQRTDDDILPTGKSARGGLKLPKPRAGKAPKTPKGATGPEAEAAPKKERRGLKGLASMELSFGKKKK